MSKRAVFTLLGGSGLAQVVSLVAAPVITRLFTPDEFGTYALVVTAVSIFGPAICLKYDMAIVSSQQSGEVQALFRLSVLIAAVGSVLVAIPYGWLVVGRRLSQDETVLVVFCVGALLFMQGISSALTSTLNRERQYNPMSTSIFFRAVASNVGFVALGVASLGVWALMAGQLLGALIAVLILGFSARKMTIWVHARRRSVRLRTVAISFVRQALYNAPTALLATATFASILIFLEFRYSPDDVGHYALGYRLLGVPIAVVTMSFARVFFERVERAKRERDPIWPLVRRAIGVLVSIVIPAMVVTALVAPSGARVVFGAEWERAGLMVAIMTPLYAARLVVESISTLFISLGRQRGELIGYFALSCLQASCFGSAVYWGWSVETFLVAVSVICATVYGVLLWLLSRWARTYDKVAKRDDDGSRVLDGRGADG